MKRALSKFDDQKGCNVECVVCGLCNVREYILRVVWIVVQCT